MQQRQRHPLTHARRGSLIPAVAVALAVLGGMMALVLNRFWIATGREELQTAVQFAALTAAAQLADDSLLQPDVNHQRRIQTIRQNTEAQLQSNPVVGQPPQLPRLRGMEFGQLVASSLTGQVSFLQTDLLPTIVRVTGVCDRREQNAIPVLMPFFTGTATAEMAESAEATIRNDLVGLRPLDGVGIPLWPIAILVSRNSETVAGWEALFSETNITDEYSWNSAERRVVLEPDDLPELIVEFSSNGAGANGCLVDIGNALDPLLIQEQMQYGISHEQLSDFGGWLDFAEFPFTTDCRWDIPRNISDQLARDIGQSRLITVAIWDRDHSAAEFGTASVQQIVGVRLMDVQRTSSSVVAIFQRAVVVTRTAVAAGQNNASVMIADNLRPDIYRVELTRSTLTDVTSRRTEIFSE